MWWLLSILIGPILSIPLAFLINWLFGPTITRIRQVYTEKRKKKDFDKYIKWRRDKQKK